MLLLRTLENIITQKTKKFSYRRILEKGFVTIISGSSLCPSAQIPWETAPPNTDKKEKKIFLIYKEIQKGSGAESYMANGLLI